MISTTEFTLDKAASAAPDNPAASAGTRRGRKPRHLISYAPPDEEEQVSILPSVIAIRKDYCGSAIVLRLEGVLDPSTVLELRDAVFTAVGARPSELCLDLNHISVPLSPLAMETLVTMSRVANLVKVKFSVLVPPTLTPEWQDAGLSRLLPVQTDPRFLAPVIK